MIAWRQYGKIKFVENRRNIIKMVVIWKINVECTVNTWRRGSILLALALIRE